MLYNKTQFISNIVIDISLIVYLIFLGFYNKTLEDIQAKYPGQMEQAFAIVSEPNFYTYFILGVLFIIVLVALVVWIIKRSILPEIKDGNLLKDLIILIFIDLVLFIVLIVMMSNPIFTAFATVMGVGGVVMCMTK